LAFDLQPPDHGATLPLPRAKVSRSARLRQPGAVVQVSGALEEDGLPLKKLPAAGTSDEGRSDPANGTAGTGSRDAARDAQSPRDTDRGGRTATERDRPRLRDGDSGDESRAGSRLRSREGENARRAAAKKDPCAEAAKACGDALKLLRDDDIASIDLDIRVSGKAGNDYPCECRLEGETFQPRRFASTTMTWKAAGYCHKPLYFEDWELERYGHSRGMFVDPFIAGAHFFVTLPILPYKAGMQAPWECVYPLGYYRPGSCAPWTVPGVPYSPRGFAVQAATVTGLVFLLP
jgi:hypothetical protein